MYLRGIQVVGLIVALGALFFMLIARKKGRVNSRFFLFGTIFWSAFIFLDLYPSIASYITPLLFPEFGVDPYTMYVLTSAATLTLFVFTFVLYSFLSDMNRKVSKLVREQAKINYKIVTYLTEKKADDKEST